MNPKIIYFLPLLAVSAAAQPICPPIRLLNAKTIELNVTNSSHLVLLRQEDGSYTAFELANASPHSVLRTIPHFEQRFSACLPRKASSHPALASPKVGAQPAAFAVLNNGNLLLVSTALNSLDVAVFDRQLQLISENQIGMLPFDDPSPGTYGAYLSLLLADVNGDGKLDVVGQFAFEHDLESFGGGGIRVLLGDGLGGFEPAGGFPLDRFVNGSMAVGDLNGDGKPDLVVGAPPARDEQGFPPGNIVLAIGKGDGTFVPSIIRTPNLIGPAAIAIADLNKDGKNDLVFLTAPLTDPIPFLTSEASVMLGNGDGTFSAPAFFPVQVTSAESAVDEFDSSPSALAIGDVNGDGIPDIVTNGITILLGDGKGGFPNRTDFLNTARESVILTDFDGDGNMDIVIGTGSQVAFSGRALIRDTLAVFFGDGTGGFAAPPVAPLPTVKKTLYLPAFGADYVTLMSGDFNHDGLADLAVLSNFQNLSVFLASAAGTLTPAFSYDFYAIDKDDSPSSVVAGDFNHDGILDLAVTVVSASSHHRIVVFLGAGDGTFLGPVNTSAPVPMNALVAGDFNKDGRLDLAAIDYSASETDHVVVFPGIGDGTFGSTQSYTAGRFAASLAIGDFNQDGSEDIAIRNETGIQLLLGKPDGTFSAGSEVSLDLGISLVAADLNGDGHLDLVASNTILLGRGNGTFAAPVSYPTGIDFSPGPGSVAVGDINGDGIPDVFTGGDNVLIGNGDGTFRLQIVDLPSGGIIAADFNGDGKLDIASGFTMFGAGLITGGQTFRLGATIFFNLSSPTAVLDVVSAADFSHGPMSPHSIASAFGKHLSLTTASASPDALPTTLGGASVSVQDQTGTASQAEIYYASPQQVNFILPPGLEAGSAIVTITTTDGQSASSEIQIDPVAPKLFTVDPSGIPAGFVVRVGPIDIQTVAPIFTGQTGNIKPVPIDLSTGDVYLVLFGTGFDNPPNDTVELGSTDTTASYAGPQHQFPGLDQINILLPKSLAGSGLTKVEVFQNHGANWVFVTIK